MDKVFRLLLRTVRDSRFRIVFLALLISFLSGSSAPRPHLEQQVRIVVEGDTAHPITLSAYQEGELVYGSLDDLASALGLRSFWNGETKKLELRLKNYRAKITGENPFIVFTDLATNTSSAHQLPASVHLRGSTLYAPLSFFLPLFEIVFERRISLYFPVESVGPIPPRSLSPFDITGLSVEPKLNGYLVRISSTRRFDEFENWLKHDGWLYVSVADAKVDVEKINRTRPTEPFSKVVAVQYPTSAQLTFKLTKNIASSEIISDPSTNDILLSLRSPSEADSIAAEEERKELLAALDGARKRWRLDVIVIDAGHGGDDPGAIGVTRAQEKNVTLGIALKLGKLIEKNLKGVKVIYTRKTDTFVELYRRGQIANAAGGKLFLSIHCNSMRRKPHRQNGFEIYLLRPGRTEEAVQIAERENAAIKLEKGYEKRYQELTEENFILVTMAQSAHMKYSERFAEILQQQMGNRLALADNGVKQAGFYVLVGASMPNVLVETAYLSNRKDEKFLKSQKGQQEIGEAIFSAVKKYKAEYEKALEEGKASD